MTKPTQNFDNIFKKFENLFSIWSIRTLPCELSAQTWTKISAKCCSGHKLLQTEVVLIALFNAWMQPCTDRAKIPKP